MANKTEFTFELEETITLKTGGKLVKGRCPKCEAEVDMVSPDVLALSTGISERVIFQMLESGHLYFEEFGRVVVCTGCFASVTAPRRGTLAAQAALCSGESGER